MIAKRRPLDACLMVAVFAVAPIATAPLHSQEVQPPRWTAALEFGSQLPSTLYDERVTARILGADTFSLSTRYSERIHALPIARLLFRYKPESDFGAYLSMQYGGAGTTANFVGGESAPQTLKRDVRIWAAELGVSVLLGKWSNGRGFFEYSFGPTYMHHRLDLSGGHRDVFALALGAPDDERLDWTRRSWSSWGLGLGAGARFPIGDALALRTSFQTHIVGVGTTQIENQEREDVRRLSGGRAPVFLYSNYTAHYPAVRVGLEYVLDRQRARPTPTVAIPRAARTAEPSAVARQAADLIAQGDSAAALELLRQRVEDDPQDGAAWHELALILATRAELGPQAREEAWHALQRAVRYNPGDDALLSAYGRVRGLMQRAGAARDEAPPLTVSTVNARADAAGVLSIAWTIQNLADAQGSMRYRVIVEVTDDLGETVPVRAADSAEPPLDVFEVERSTAAQPVVERLELRLARARPGPHSLRVRVVDLETGQTVDGVTGFLIR